MKGAPESHRKTPVPLVPQRHGGALQRGNPGNKGGGRRSAEAEALAIQRAEEIATDTIVWDVRLAQARAGDLNSHKFAHEVRFGKPKEQMAQSGELVIRIVKEEKGKPRAGP